MNINTKNYILENNYDSIVMLADLLTIKMDNASQMLSNVKERVDILFETILNPSKKVEFDFSKSVTKNFKSLDNEWHFSMEYYLNDFGKDELKVGDKTYPPLSISDDARQNLVKSAFECKPIIMPLNGEKGTIGAQIPLLNLTRLNIARYGKTTISNLSNALFELKRSKGYLHDIKDSTIEILDMLKNIASKLSFATEFANEFSGFNFSKEKIDSEGRLIADQYEALPHLVINSNVHSNSLTRENFLKPTGKKIHL